MRFNKDSQINELDEVETLWNLNRHCTVAYRHHFSRLDKASSLLIVEVVGVIFSEYTNAFTTSELLDFDSDSKKMGMQEISEECHSTLWYPLEQKRITQPCHLMFQALLSQAPMPSAIIVGKHHQILCGDNYYKCRLPLASAVGMYYFLLVPVNCNRLA